ncbi:hypothetical protein JTB14_000886 [Gonioctena quinquepunctata]|nr:hypothetical protein JTB14_000886 [Gonioctena quinquepunctata]
MVSFRLGAQLYDHITKIELPHRRTSMMIGLTSLSPEKQADVSWKRRRKWKTFQTALSFVHLNISEELMNVILVIPFNFNFFQFLVELFCKSIIPFNKII